jgi:hypothetical protein
VTLALNADLYMIDISATINPFHIAFRFTFVISS